MRGFVLMAVTLAVLEAAVSSPAAAGRAGVLLSLPGSIARYVISPTLPAIPETRTRANLGQAPAVDNPFATAQLNSQLISATWNTSANAAAASTGTEPLSPQTIGV